MVTPVPLFSVTPEPPVKMRILPQRRLNVQLLTYRLLIAVNPYCFCFGGVAIRQSQNHSSALQSLLHLLHLHALPFSVVSDFLSPFFRHSPTS